jgi:hypothetical protein
MEVAHLRCAAGDTVAGYKVGCVGPGVVEQFGVSGPIHARLFRSEIRNSGETLQYSAYANLAIEGEMAVRIGTNPSSRIGGFLRCPLVADQRVRSKGLHYSECLFGYRHIHVDRLAVLVSSARPATHNESKRIRVRSGIG